MSNDTIHLITNEFSRGIGHDLDWWKYRLDLYKTYTLNSLVNQTNQNFYLLMLVDNRLLLYNDLEEILKQSGLKYLLIRKNLENDFKEKMRTLPDSKYIYSTRIDTDDVFRYDVVEEIQKYDYSDKRLLVYQKGYCYDVVNRRLQHYFAKSPPFYTIMFPKEVFVDDTKRNEYVGVKSHDQMFNSMKPLVLSENKYIVLIHEKNLSSVYLENETRLNRFEIPKNEHFTLLKDFGINEKT